jgi:hypothetical protein
VALEAPQLDEGHGPFDPGLATVPTRLVPLRKVVDLLVVSNAPDRVAVYRAAMLAGDHFPPIAVLPLLGRFLVTDGHKRLAAYRELGQAEIVVEVWTVGRLLRDLWQQSRVQQRRVWSVLRRLPRENAARREAAAMARQEAAHWRRIARSLWANLRGGR